MRRLVRRPERRCRSRRELPPAAPRPPQGTAFLPSGRELSWWRALEEGTFGVRRNLCWWRAQSLRKCFVVSDTWKPSCYDAAASGPPLKATREKKDRRKTGTTCVNRCELGLSLSAASSWRLRSLRGFAAGRGSPCQPRLCARIRSSVNIFFFAIKGVVHRRRAQGQGRPVVYAAFMQENMRRLA